MRSWIVIAAGFLLVGCVSIDTTNKSRIASTFDDIKASTTLGAMKTAKLGEAIISERNYSKKTQTLDVMEVSEDFRLTGFDEPRDFGRGEKLAIVGERKINGATHTIARPTDWYVALQIAPDGSLTPALINSDVEMVWKATATPSTVRFKRVPFSVTTTSGNGLNYDLAYNGTEGQSMKFQYREYRADDLNRPVISQDFAFPLASKLVEFRGLSFEVESATATEIAFTVKTLLPASSSQAPPLPPVQKKP